MLDLFIFTAAIVIWAALLAWFALKIILPILRRSFLDEPNQRSSHCLPTPRGGGIVFVSIACIASFLYCFIHYFSASESSTLFVAPLISLPLALVGYIDDRHKIPVFWRYGVQLGTALLVILVSPLVQPVLGVLPMLALLLIAVTAVINFTNFMDGLDGLVAGCMAVAMIAASIQLAAPWPIWALVGALLGFMLWNWSPAKLFMGDVGSTFLGAVFAVLVLQASSWPEALALLLVATPLLGDACLCVPRRLIAGQQVFQAHRLHLFQRLHQAGWSHARVSSFYISATAVLAIALLLGGLTWVIALAVLELLIGICLDRQVAVSFAVASRT
ncbi:glycosyltransferase family 4 protein [bacterium]|nr:glycosyltransferase family 4 protein [bacterium]